MDAGKQKAYVGKRDSRGRFAKKVKDILVANNGVKVEANSFLPLMYGKPVVMKVNSVSLPKSNRYPDRFLMVAPSSLYGIDGGYFIFSVTGGGCEVLSREDFKPIRLLKLGLTSRGAKLIAEKLKEIF